MTSKNTAGEEPPSKGQRHRRVSSIEGSVASKGQRHRRVGAGVLVAPVGLEVQPQHNWVQPQLYTVYSVQYVQYWEYQRKTCWNSIDSAAAAIVRGQSHIKMRP
jgi:hypothetical protein